MNNDLISREALKEVKFLTPQVKVIGGRHNGKMREQIIQAYQKGWNDAIDAIIDNAPTVETPCEQESELIKAYTKGFNTGVEIVKNARLQGEWLFVSRNCWKCPYCQELTNEGKNFCPNCGAYMRGENNG